MEKNPEYVLPGEYTIAMKELHLTFSPETVTQDSERWRNFVRRSHDRNLEEDQLFSDYV